MSNTAKTLVESILKDANHKDDKNCLCARCDTGELLEKYFRKFDLVVVPNSENAATPISILGSVETVVRERRTIQNEENKYCSSKQVQKMRREREKDWRKKYSPGEDQFE